MFFDEDALRQVFEQQEFKVVELVVGVCFNTIVRKVGIDLGTPLEGVAVLIAKSVEYIDFILASVLNLIVENFAIALQVFSAACNTLEKLVTVRKALELINSSRVFSDDSMDKIMLNVNFALEKLDTGAEQILESSDDSIACEAFFDRFKVISRGISVSF
jgi:hypothetical protein